ncbi:uncharacterized protein TNCV_647751 [Trichonephila clavipes]|uniref:Uncharacterized protein n=1 Tax=Trichonephila clavipes TaxID=2585209 RepID=A0A8X6SM86_TRICX|nr:uncharacterized protein TNCV_647751 [Trichonephila clavipes]
MSAYMRQKVKSKYRNRIRLERASQEKSNCTTKTPYDRVKQCQERKRMNGAELTTTVPVHLQLGQLKLCKWMMKSIQWHSVGFRRLEICHLSILIISQEN